jgi:hypothetical protein
MTLTFKQDGDYHEVWNEYQLLGRITKYNDKWRITPTRTAHFTAEMLIEIAEYMKKL